MIEASLEEAMSTKSTGVVIQPMVSFTIHSCFDYHLPYTLNKTGNESVINKSISKSQIPELSCMSNLRDSFKFLRDLALYPYVLLVQCSFTNVHT